METKTRFQNAANALHANASDSIEIASAADDDDDEGASPPSPSPSSSPSSSSSSVPADLVEVATFGAPHGVRGEVRIFPVTDEPEERLLEEGARFWVAPQVETKSSSRGGGRGGILLGRGSSSPAASAAAAAAARPRLVRIEAARAAPLSRSKSKGSSPDSPGSSSWLLKLRGVDSPEAAAAFANNSLWMSAAERPALPESGDDFYAQELIGMEARLVKEAGKGSERLVGVVVDVCGGGGTDLLRLELSDDDDEEEEEEEEGREKEKEEEFDEEVQEGEEAAAEAEAAAAKRLQRRQQKATPAVSSSARRTVLLPFTREFVPHVDRSARRMTICPPDGLLDLAILPPKAQLKQQQEQEAAALAAAAASAGGAKGGGGAGEEKKQSRPRRPRGRKARDRAGGGAAAPPSA